MKRIGRWIDFENDYKTLDPTYMESVWWVFRQLWDKGLVYRGFKVGLHGASAYKATVHNDSPSISGGTLYAAQLQACPSRLPLAQCDTCRSCLTPQVCPRLWPTLRPTRTTKTLWTRVSWYASTPLTS